MKDLTLPQKILLLIEEKGTMLYETLYHPSKTAYHYVETSDRVSKQALYNVVGRLKREGYLAEVEKNGQKRLKTTIKGHFKISRFLKRDKKWDNKWRIVIFDVPETKKEMRNFFREKLADMGFRKLQESVWISPYDIANEVEDLVDLCAAKPYIHYLLVEELDNKNILMELFNLKEGKSNKYNATAK